MSKRAPLKHLKIPTSLGVGEGGKTMPLLYSYFQQIDDYIDELKEETSGSDDNELADRLGALETKVDDKADKNTLNDYAKTSDIPDDYLTKTDLEGYAKQSDLNTLEGRVDDLEEPEDD